MGAFARAAKAASALTLARLEFAALELTQHVSGALRWLLWALAATVLGMLALITLTATLAIVLWDRFGWYSTAVLSLVYVAAAVYLAYRLARAIRTAPTLLHQTLAELSKDRESILAAAEGSGPETET